MWIKEFYLLSIAAKNSTDFSQAHDIITGGRLTGELEQSPGFLLCPPKLHFLKKMPELWNRGLAEAGEADRLEALGHCIGNADCRKMFRLHEE